MGFLTHVLQAKEFKKLKAAFHKSARLARLYNFTLSLTVTRYLNTLNFFAIPFFFLHSSLIESQSKLSKGEVGALVFPNSHKYTQTALGESPRTPLAPWSTEKAETHPHKSKLRGSPPPHLLYPHTPFLAVGTPFIYFSGPGVQSERPHG